MVILVGVLYSLFLQTFIRDEVFYSGDAGLKALLAKQFNHGLSDVALNLPAPDWAKDLWNQGYYPFAPIFVYTISGRHFIAFDFLFSLITAPFYQAFGYRGLYVVPLLSIWLVWLIFFFICRRAELNDTQSALAFASLIFSSPLTIYSALYWEHTLATALVLFSFFLFLWSEPRTSLRGFVGGLLLSVSIFFRPEVYCLVIATLVVMYTIKTPLTTTQKGSFLSGCLAGLFALWLSNHWIYGSFIGIHSFVVTKTYSLLQHAAIYFLILKFLIAQLILFFPIVFFCAISLFKHLTNDSEKLIWFPSPMWVLLLAVILLVPAVVPNYGGKQWGPRYYLIILPFVCMCAMWTLKASQSLRPMMRNALMIVFLICFSFGVYKNTYAGTVDLREDYAVRVLPALQEIRQRPERVVVVSQQHVAQEMESLLDQKIFFRSLANADLQRMAPSFVENGASSFLFVNHLIENEPQSFQSGGYGFRFSKIGNFGIYRLFLVAIQPTS